MSLSFKNETQVYEWLSKNLPDLNHVTRIETTTAPGVPDVNFVCQKREGWLELKVGSAGANFPHEQMTVEVRTAQLSWISEHLIAGGLATVLIGTDTGHLIIVDPWSLPRLRVPFIPWKVGTYLHASNPRAGKLVFSQLKLIHAKPWSQYEHLFIKGMQETS